MTGLKFMEWVKSRAATYRTDYWAKLCDQIENDVEQWNGLTTDEKPKHCEQWSVNVKREGETICVHRHSAAPDRSGCASVRLRYLHSGVKADFTGHKYRLLDSFALERTMDPAALSEMLLAELLFGEAAVSTTGAIEVK